MRKKRAQAIADAAAAAAGKPRPLRAWSYKGAAKPPSEAPSMDWEDDPQPGAGRGVAADTGLESALATLLSAGHAPQGGDEIEGRQKQFDDLVKLALDDALYIARLKPDPTDPNFTKILTRKSAVIAAVMSAVVRIDEARLRAVRQGKVDQVLNALRELKARTVN